MSLCNQVVAQDLHSDFSDWVIFFLFYPNNLPPFLVAYEKELKYWRESYIPMQYCSNLQTALPQAGLLVRKIVVNMLKILLCERKSLYFLPLASQLPSRNAWLLYLVKGETVERSALFMFVPTAPITWFSIEVVPKEIRL